MKKVLLVLFLAVSTFAVSYAQKKDTTQTHAKQKSAKAHKPSPMKQINLTKDQEAKIKLANKNYKEKSKQVKADTSISAADRKAKLKELSKEKKKGVDTVLTAEQKTKLKELHKQNKANLPQKSKPSTKTKTAVK